ncbi:Rgp1-domain-containing protein [Cytidiella melzeri]|nr:Rgp1-domain-containing protein [Cytidiella melzeri]
MLSQPKVDEAVRVVVTPSQAAYFAGERLSITITITNTRAPQATLQSYSASQSQSLHKRSAHSVSHVPMARPPTSPGTRTAGPVTSARPVPGGVVLVRRGTIGKTKPSKGVEESNESADQTRRRLLLNRSQSISLSTQDFRPDTQVDARGKSPLRTLRTLEAALPHKAPTSSRLFSPLARSASVPAHHPHARKQSVSDVQVQLSPFDPAAPPLTPNASTYSLTLDPIAEGVTSPMPPQTPAISSPSSSVIFTHPPLPSSASAPTELRAATADTASRAGNSHQHVQSVLGRGPPPIIVQSPKPRASSSFITAPSNELVLYSYAQLSGTISIRPLADLPQTSDQIKALQSLRRSLLRSKAVGGGSMDITTHNSNTFTSGSHLPSPPHRSTHARSSSLSGSLLSVLSPSSHLPSAFPISSLDRTRRAARHGRSPSIFASIFQPAASSSSRMSGLGLSVNPSEEEDTDGDTPLPTFEVRPSMLAIDLNLSPGESRSYTYELDLPHNLPPSYRGRALKLSYEFVTGICRASSSASAGPESHSRVMKVPIRVYNNVAIGSPVATYDLLWPTAARNGVPSPQGSSTAVVTELRNSLKKYLLLSGLSPKLDRTRTAESVRMYARDLILHADSLGRLDDAPSYLSSEFRAAQNLHGDDMHFQGDISCREAVEVLTRNPKKLSFDVNKDGIKVAVLTFTKSAYRLGETVLGVVELNSRASRARVLKLSALLEAHESLPTCLAPPPPSTSRQMRRIHAEHHSSFMTSTMRTTFSLDIPPDASPTFRIAVPSYASGGSSYGGLEWKVRINLLVAVASPNAREGADGIRFKTLVVDGPRGEWGTTWTAARTIAPSERTSPLLATGDSLETPRATQSWTSFLTSTFLGSTEPVDQYHDGDEEVDEEGHEHDDEGEWKEVKVEMVECEVPIKVWPGNTAFKASEVVFEV